MLTVCYHEKVITKKRSSVTPFFLLIKASHVCITMNYGNSIISSPSIKENSNDQSCQIAYVYEFHGHMLNLAVGKL